MSATELNLILNALNDREGVLASEWEAANRANSSALMRKLSNEIDEVRELGYKIAKQLIDYKRLAA